MDTSFFQLDGERTAVTAQRADATQTINRNHRGGIIENLVGFPLWPFPLFAAVAVIGNCYVNPGIRLPASGTPKLSTNARRCGSIPVTCVQPPNCGRRRRRQFISDMANDPFGLTARAYGARRRRRKAA